MFDYLARKRRVQLSKGLRRAEQKKINRILGRTLRHESLEDRRVLTLLGVTPLELPTFDFDSGGTTSYDHVSDIFSVSATPLESDTQIGIPGNEGLFFNGTFDIDITVDAAGNLVGGVAGDDLVLTGTVDFEFDLIPEYVDLDGPLLTGEILSFGHQDSGGTTDQFDFIFQITGGQMAGLYPNGKLAVSLNSENSTFTGDFNVSFIGGAKGAMGAIIEDEPEEPGIEIVKLTNGMSFESEEDAPLIDAGDAVIFTYQVTNTGNVAFDFEDVVVVDDNGTPGNLLDDLSSADGELVFLAASDDGDGILSPGETWQYEFVTTALDLTSPAVTFNFAGSSSLDGADGNIRTYTAGGIAVKVSGWSRNKTTDAFSTAYVGAYPGGLGVTDAADGTGSNNQHTVDNSSTDNYLLFEFDDMVVIDQAFLGYVAGDSDLTVWIGTATDPFNNHLTLSSALLSSLGFTEVNLGGSSARWADLNAGGVAGNVLVVAAKTGDYNDFFKLEKLKTAKLKDCYENVATVTVPGAMSSDTSGYCNPETPTPNEEAPCIDFNSGGLIAFDATTGLWTLNATPLNMGPGFFFDGDLDISAVLSNTGALLSGIAGDDLMLVGELDLNGDFIADVNGVLLRAEIIDFQATDSGGTTDTYQLRFAVTGGLLAHMYIGQDLIVEVTSENSTFTGSFASNFTGGAKGEMCPDDSMISVMASVGNYFFIDTDGNGLQNTGDFGVNGVTVNLLNTMGMVIASTETDYDANGNAGFYLFYNLQAGNYIVEFEIPEDVEFTTKDAGDDSRDSDVNVNTGRTDVVTLAAGEHRRDVDAGVKGVVEVEKVIYKIKDHKVKNQDSKAGKIDDLYITYSEDLDELYVSINMEEYKGRLADGFSIVITAGQWPSGYRDKYAVFYFDADVNNRMGGPVLTVYGFNGNFDSQSYRDSNGNLRTNDADLVATSLNNSNGWVKELDVDTYRQDGKWHRTMTFKIVASEVNDHVPLRGTGWGGAQMGNKAAYSIDTFDGIYSKYNSNGFLKKWEWSCRGGTDVCKVYTEQCVIECDAAIEEFFDDFGWTVTAYVDGISDGDPPTDFHDEESDFDWAGSVDAALEDVFA